MKHFFSVRRLATLALLVTGLVAGALLWPGAPWQRASAPAMPSPPPTLTMIDIHGKRIVLGDLRGKVLIVNFWSPACAPCLKEMPIWTETRRAHAAQGLEVLAVSMPTDAPNHVIAFAESRQLPFPVLLDVVGEANRAFGGIQVMPTTFLLNRQGQVVHKFVGIPRSSDLQAQLQRLL